jgi:hypothetical protein
MYGTVSSSHSSLGIVAPTVPQLHTATVAKKKRNPLATFFRRLVGVIAGIPLLLVVAYGFWNGWVILSGIFMLDVQRIIAGVLIEALMTVVGGLLFWIVRWGFEMDD